jgi:hypothetical protein
MGTFHRGTLQDALPSLFATQNYGYLAAMGCHSSVFLINPTGMRRNVLKIWMWNLMLVAVELSALLLIWVSLGAIIGPEANHLKILREFFQFRQENAAIIS